jgi:hypothetical protein
MLECVSIWALGRDGLPIGARMRAVGEPCCEGPPATLRAADALASGGVNRYRPVRPATPVRKKTDVRCTPIAYNACNAADFQACDGNNVFGRAAGAASMAG